MKNRKLLNSSRQNAGLARLSGGVGFGFAQAGNQMVKLANDIDGKNILTANKLALKKEGIAKADALRAKNYVTNPQMVSKINAKYGITGDLAKDLTAPTLANASIGLIDLGPPKVKDGFSLKAGETRYSNDGKPIASLGAMSKEKTTKFSTRVSEDGYYIKFNERTGAMEKTNQKAKDWNNGGSSNKKSSAPVGYKFAGEYNISDTLDYELATSGSYFTDKNGKRFVNEKKYKNLIDLGNTEIK